MEQKASPDINDLKMCSDLNAQKKKTMLVVLVVILSLLVLGLGSYLIIDKVTSDNNSGDQEAENDNDNDKKQVIALDINSSIVQNLPYPINQYELGRPAWNFKDIDIHSLGRTNMMLSAYAYVESEGDNPDFVDDGWGIYVSASKVEASFRQVFGSNADYSNGDVMLPHGGFGCGTIGEFDATRKAYIVIWGCGGDTPFVWDNVTKLYKAEQYGDDIHVYFYVQPFGLVWDSELMQQTPFLYKRELADNFYDEVVVNNNMSSRAKNYTKRVGSLSEIEDIVNNGKAETYKFTFRKQSDGKYYFYSGKWQ